MPTSPRHGSMIAGRVVRKRAQRLRWNIKRAKEKIKRPLRRIRKVHRLLVYIAGLIRSYGARQSQEDPLGSSRLGDDVRRWVRWLKAGLPGDVWGHPRSAHSHVYALRPIGVIGIQEIDSPLI
jgi:hypothetical protein